VFRFFAGVEISDWAMVAHDACPDFAASAFGLGFCGSRASGGCCGGCGHEKKFDNKKIFLKI
jgi:hypothetical protein